MFHHARDHPHVEVGGYLFGRVYATDAEAAVVVEGMYPIVSADATVSHFRIRIEDSQRASEFQDQQFPQTEIVGWYHTHPGHSVFMSGVDQHTQRTYFAAFHRVAMVIDPQHRTFAAFILRDGEVGSLPCIEVLEENVNPVRERLVAMIPVRLTRPDGPAGASQPASPTVPLEGAAESAVRPSASPRAPTASASNPALTRQPPVSAARPLLVLVLTILIVLLRYGWHWRWR